MTTPDYHALCAELVDTADEICDLMESYRLGDYLPDSFTVQPLACAIDRARSLLAAPEAVGVADEDPSDEDLLRLLKVATPCYAVEEWRRELDAIRAAIARYGTAHPAPVPVGERLPGAGDMKDRACWWYSWDTWLYRTVAFVDGEPLPMTNCEYWLPHWALPLPGAQP
jgi:hypothetical protein